MIRNHKDLDVWKQSIDFVEDIYKLTKSFPKEEIYGLSSQMRRASISVSSNISEGASRNSYKEFIQFLFVSLGSASELETQIIIAQRLGYAKKIDEILEKLTNIKKMLNGLIRHLRNR